MRVLVYRTGHLGDTVCAIPAFWLIRRHFAEADLTLLCDRPRGGKVPAGEVIENLHLFNRITTYTSGRGVLTAWELARLVRAARPDLVVMLPQVRESAAVVRRKRKFFHRCGVEDVRGLQFPYASHSWQPNEPTRLVQMLHGAGLRGAKPAYAIPVDAAAQASVRAKLAAIDVGPDEPFLLFSGGGKASTQHWPLTRYAAVLQAVTAAVPWPVVGLGSSAEVEAYREQVLPRFAGLRLLNSALSVTEIFELCRLATAYLGNDTGPMHVSASVGCPVAVVMSARNAPGAWDPDVEPRLVVRHRTECEDCFLNECVTEQRRCLTAITVERVVAEVIPFLKSLLPTR